MCSHSHFITQATTTLSDDYEYLGTLAMTIATTCRHTGAELFVTGPLALKVTLLKSVVSFFITTRASQDATHSSVADVAMSATLNDAFQSHSLECYNNVTKTLNPHPYLPLHPKSKEKKGKILCTFILFAYAPASCLSSRRAASRASHVSSPQKLPPPF